MRGKRRRFIATEKAKIALEAIKGELTMAQIASKYSVHATQVNTWKRQALDHLPDAFGDSHRQETVNHENQLAELYEQIGRLKVENDFLKKKSDLFCGGKTNVNRT